MKNIDLPEVFMPFDLPDTEEARAWYFELEFVDLIEGAQAELEALMHSAPCQAAMSFLAGILHTRAQLGATA